MGALEQNAGPFLRGLPFFAGLPEADIEAFLAEAKIRNYPKNRALFTQGDPASRFFVMVSGWVKLYRITGEGEESVIALFTRGDVFGEAAIFTGAVYPFSAAAAEDAQVVEIHSDILKTKARANADIMARIMDSMSREIHNLQMENEHMALMSAPQRVGCLLLQLSSGMIGKGGTFTFPFDKSLAAARLGMKPETFSRALGQLKEVGVAVKGPEIKIDSFDCLVGYCCGDCSAQSDECNGRREAACCREGSCASGQKRCGG
jgi:CRP-like cAMP-binding protein